MVKKHHGIPHLRINGKAIDYVFQYKYLGTTIDEMLSFHSHSNPTIRLVACKIFLLHEIRSDITEHTYIKDR